MRSIPTVAFVCALLAVALAGLSCSKKDPKSENASRPTTFRVWPAPDERPAWRAELLAWSTGDVDAYQRFLEQHFNGRSEELRKKIEQEVGLMVEYKTGKYKQRREEVERALNVAREKRDLDMLWNALIMTADKDPLFPRTNERFWRLHAMVALVKKEYDLAIWSADNSLILDPLAGEAMFLKGLALKAPRPEGHEAEFRAIMDAHVKKLETDQEKLEFYSRFQSMMKDMK